LKLFNSFKKKENYTSIFETERLLKST